MVPAQNQNPRVWDLYPWCLPQCLLYRISTRLWFWYVLSLSRISVKSLYNTQPKMQNEEGQITELYIPRNSATNRLITAKDHASVQVNIGHVDENGVYNGHFSTFALCGFIRAQGDADSALDRLWQKKKVEVKQQ
ncbi:40S ribosomal protein S21 [Glycine soja]